MDASNTRKQDLIVEPLMLKHILMLRAKKEFNLFGEFQILLFNKFISSIESNLVNIFPSRTPTCFVAIEDKNIIAYMLATPNNRRSSCWTISEPKFILESFSYSRYNILRKLLQKVLDETEIKTQSFLIYLNTNDNQQLSVAREAGFQPLRIVKYWRRKLNSSDITENIEKGFNFNWVQLNIDNVQQVWRLEQARESVNLRSIFDRQWNDILEKKTALTGVITDKENRILAALITSFCPNKEYSLELIRGLAWDPRLNLSVPNNINRIHRINNNVSIETTSEDKQLNDLMDESGWEVFEEKILLGRNIWRRKRTYNVMSIENNLSAIMANLQQQPELPTPLKSNKVND